MDSRLLLPNLEPSEARRESGAPIHSGKRVDKPDRPLGVEAELGKELEVGEPPFEGRSEDDGAEDGLRFRSDVVEPKSLSEYGVDVPLRRDASKWRTELVLLGSSSATAHN